MSKKIFTKDSQQQLVEENSNTDDALNYKEVNLENENAMGFNYLNPENALENVLEHATENSPQELSAWKKACFAMAGLTYQMYFCAVSVFAVVFLLNSAKLPPAKNT
jgi:hypothetical protein